MSTLREYTIIQALDEPLLFKTYFGGESWRNWRVVLKGIFGLKLSWGERRFAKKHLGYLPLEVPAREVYLQVGRRGGKTQTIALTACFIACFRSFKEFLAPGEWATVLIISPTREQANDVMERVRQLLHVPLLEHLIQRETENTIELINGVRVTTAAADYKHVRGTTVACCIIDEACFLQTQASVNTDQELLTAIRPAMLTIPNSLLLVSSTPYTKRGAFYQAYEKYFQKPTPGILFFKATTREMNPLIPETTVTRALAEDYDKNVSEYLAEYRRDITGLLTLEQVLACVDTGVVQRPPGDGQHYAFFDSSGGVSDSMVLAIAHVSNNSAVVDVIIEKVPPFNIDLVVLELSLVLKRYRLYQLTGDAYTSEWVKQAFSKNGISYIFSDLSRSEIYREALPILLTRRARLLDMPQLTSQLVALERIHGRNVETIDHPKGMHDDVANACAGVIVLAAKAEIHEGDALGVIEEIKHWTAEKWTALKNKFDQLGRKVEQERERQLAEKPQAPVVTGGYTRCGCNNLALLRKVAGGQTRCAQCGTQWWENGAPQVYRVKRDGEAGPRTCG